MLGNNTVKERSSVSPPTPSMFEAPDPNLEHSNYDSRESVQPIVSFGLIADIQYADNDDRFNFTKTSLRRYRNASKLVDEACQYWSQHQYPISFILQLGDLIDGVAKTNNQSQQDLTHILGQFKKTFPQLPVYHIWGNHELYNFSRAELLKGTLSCFSNADIDPGHYGSIEVCPHLRIITLDTYEFSALGIDETSDLYQEAMHLLRKYNQNENPNNPPNCHGHQKRFVQFNGGLSSKQLSWLSEQLTAAKNREEKVILAGEQNTMIVCLRCL
jgi:manganese-dependent ADP-ribose/CDP-alcohol diphosphatase